MWEPAPAILKDEEGVQSRGWGAACKSTGTRWVPRLPSVTEDH